jgi:hypothetical protein
VSAAVPEMFDQIEEFEVMPILGTTTWIVLEDSTKELTPDTEFTVLGERESASLHSPPISLLDSGPPLYANEPELVTQVFGDVQSPWLTPPAATLPSKQNGTSDAYTVIGTELVESVASVYVEALTLHPPETTTDTMTPSPNGATVGVKFTVPEPDELGRNFR